MLLKLSLNAAPSVVHSCCVFCAASQLLSLIVGLPRPIAVQNVLQLRAVIVSLHHVTPPTTLHPFGMLVHVLPEHTGAFIGQTLPHMPQLLASLVTSVHMPPQIFSVCLQHWPAMHACV